MLAGVRFRTRGMPHFRAWYGRMDDLSVAILAGRAPPPNRPASKPHYTFRKNLAAFL